MKSGFNAPFAKSRDNKLVPTTKIWVCLNVVVESSIHFSRVRQLNQYVDKLTKIAGFHHISFC
jgi:hypothetical protein